MESRVGKDGRRQSQVEYPVGFFAILEIVHDFVHVAIILLAAVGADDVAIETPEFIVKLLLAGIDDHVWLDAFAQILDVAITPRVAEDPRVPRQQIVAVQIPQRRVDLAFRQVSLSVLFVLKVRGSRGKF